MNKLIKLMILLLLSTSVIVIYNKTKDSSYLITNIGDKLSQGINSYGKKEYSYVDYFKDEIKKTKNKVDINNEYSMKDQTIEKINYIIRNNKEIKRVLMNTNCLILTLGYNDILEKISLEEDLTTSKLNRIIKEISNNYHELLIEIKKYYHEPIIIIGYYENSKKEEINRTIKKLNESIQEEEDTIYIDTNELLLSKEKYFSNPKSYYPNSMAYYTIARKIIQKTLEK